MHNNVRKYSFLLRDDICILQFGIFQWHLLLIYEDISVLSIYVKYWINVLKNILGYISYNYEI